MAKDTGTRKRPPLDKCSAICKAVLERIDEESRALKPTPYKGEMVGWCANMHKRPDGEYTWYPAVVTEVLAPGRITLEVFGASQKMIKSPGQYIHHPSNLKSHDVTLGTEGGWFYRQAYYDDTFRAPKTAFQLHAAALEKREQLCLADEEARQNQAIERERRMNPDGPSADEVKK